MRLSPDSGKSIPATAYQAFIFVSDSIKLGRVCSSNVYSLLRTKAEVVFMTIQGVVIPIGAVVTAAIGVKKHSRGQGPFLVFVKRSRTFQTR